MLFCGTRFLKFDLGFKNLFINYHNGGYNQTRPRNPQLRAIDVKSAKLDT